MPFWVYGKKGMGMKFRFGNKNNQYIDDEDIQDIDWDDGTENEYYDEDEYEESYEDTEEYEEEYEETYEDDDFQDLDQDAVEEDLEEIEYYDEEEEYEEPEEDFRDYDVESQFVAGAVEESVTEELPGEILYEEEGYTEGMNMEVEAQYVDGATDIETIEDMDEAIIEEMSEDEEENSDEPDYSYEESEEKPGFHLEPLDIALILMGVLVVAVAIGLCVFFVKRMGKQPETIPEQSTVVAVGSQLEGIDIVGETGLDALAQKHEQLLAEQEAEVEETEQPTYEENDYTKTVAVAMTLTSVQKDLKIKFVNREANKLVSNVPFVVTVTKPDNTTEEWSDNDYDGVIYKKGLAAGNYSIKIQTLDADKYKGYVLPGSDQKVEVKDKISYTKVEVKDEIKKESEVNVSKEDTKVHETVVESVIKDTVEWVASSEVGGTYTEVLKEDIKDPMELLSIVKNTTFNMIGDMVFAEEENTGSEASNEVVQTENTEQKEQGTDAENADSSEQKPDNATGDSEQKPEGDTGSSEQKPAGESGTTGENQTEQKPDGDTGAVEQKPESETPGAIEPPAEEKPKPEITMKAEKVSYVAFVEEPLTIKMTLTGQMAEKPELKSFEVSNSASCKVELDGMNVKFTALNTEAPTISLKVIYEEDGVTAEAPCVIVIRSHPKNDKTTKLYTKDDKPLFVYENEVYREAVYADYYSAEHFYISAGAKYTGWQTVDGKVYFYNGKGEKVTGEQIIQGATYKFDEEGVLITESGTMGIDVSKWNGDIDWNAVKNSGVSYVIIRCGYRGSSQGLLIEDSKFAANIQGAAAVGLKVGVYFFTQAVDEVEAVYEASFVIEKLKGYKITYPVFLDVEPSGGRADKIDSATRTAVCKAFCETIKSAGYTPGIYANKTWLSEKMDASALSSYKIWLAQYAATPTYGGKYDLWQYKDTGKIAGIKGDVDLNISLLGY